MRAVLFSLRPERCRKIDTGEKIIEVRKTEQKQLETPFKGFLYCTLSGCNEFFKNDLHGDVAAWNRENWGLRKGHVWGEFVCDRVDYGRGTLYGIHISRLTIYDSPRELSEFRRVCGNAELTLRRQPQSWCYVEGPTSNQRPRRL